MVLEQAAVSNFVGQRVLEGVLDIRQELDLVQKFRRLEAVDRSLQIIFGDLGNSLQQSKRQRESGMLTDSHALELR